MSNSVLTSTKKILGIDEAYTVFDQDIITHINATFSVIQQLGVGPISGFFITDATTLWSDLDVPPEQLAMIRTYVFLKVRSLFDPPNTSFLINATEKQLQEYEWRLNNFREIAGGGVLPVPPMANGILLMADQFNKGG